MSSPGRAAGDVERLLAALREVRADGVGLGDWSLLVQESRSLALGVKDREIANAHAPLTLAESCEVRYRLVWEDGRVSRGNLERSQWTGDPLRALCSARSASADDPDAREVRGPAVMPEVAMHDESTAAIAGGDTALLAQRIEDVRGVVAAGEVRTWSGSFSASDGCSRVITSAGLDFTSVGTSASWHLVLDGEASDGFGARRPESDAEFRARLARLFDTSRQLARPAAEVPGGRCRVLLSPDVVEAYVLGTLLDNLTGSTVAHGQGHFRREQFASGRPLLREDLTLRVDPLLPLRRGSYRCTTEGVPAAPCSFIERGCLLRPIVDLKYARRLGLEPTPLPLASDTLFLEGPPELTFDEALAEADVGVLVLSVLGVHTQDGASGDFSLSAPQALAVSGGTLAGRLRGTIAGNLFRLLAADDLKLVRFAGEHTPGLLVTCRFDPP